MNTEHFTLLLEDLYQRYNHTRISEVPNLVEKYNGQEFDAIKTFYFKYNFKSHPNYDPKAGSDSFIKNLIESYSNGNRPIRDFKKDEETSEAEKQIKALTEELKNSKQEWESSIIKFKSELNEFMESKKNFFTSYEHDIKESWLSTTKNIDLMVEKKEKEIAEFIKKFDEQIELRVNQLQPQITKEEEFDVSYIITNSDLKISFPESISKLSSGNRFLIKDENNNTLCFEIKSVFLDYITNQQKPIKEISLERI